MLLYFIYPERTVAMPPPRSILCRDLIHDPGLAV